MTKQEALTLCNEILQKTGVAEILNLPNLNNRTHLSKRTQDEMEKTANRKALDFAISLQEYPNYDWLYNKLSDLQDYFVTADQKDGLEIYNQLHANRLSVFFDKAVNIYSRYDNVDLFDQAYNLYSLLTDIRKYKKSHFETQTKASADSPQVKAEASNEPQLITTKQEAGALCNEILQKTGVAEILKMPNLNDHQKLSSRTQSKQEKQAEEIASTFAQWFSISPNYDWLYKKLSDLQDYFATADQKDGLEIYNQLHANWLYAIFVWALKNDFAPYPTIDLQEEIKRKLLKDNIAVIQSIKKWAKSVKSQQPISEPINKETTASTNNTQPEVAASVEPQQIDTNTPIVGSKVGAVISDDTASVSKPQQVQQPANEPRRKSKVGRPKQRQRKPFRAYIIEHAKEERLIELLKNKREIDFACLITAAVHNGLMFKPKLPAITDEFGKVCNADTYGKISKYYDMTDYAQKKYKENMEAAEQAICVIKYE